MGTETSDGVFGAASQFVRRADSRSTQQAYARELCRFLAWLPDRPHSETLLDYRDYLRAHGLSATTVRWRTTVVRAFLNFAESRGCISPGVVGDFKPPKGSSGFAPRVLTADELRQLLNAPDLRSRRGRRDRAVLVCLGVGGLRAGEVCRLGARDVQIKSSGLGLRVHGKGRKQRLVNLPQSHVAILLRYLASWPESSELGNPLFWCGQPGRETRRLTVAAVDYLVRKHSRATNLAGVSAHALRHTAASLAIEAGEPLHRLRDRLGHSSVLVTSRYLHVTQAALT